MVVCFPPPPFPFPSRFWFRGRLPQRLLPSALLMEDAGRREKGAPRIDASRAAAPGQGQPEEVAKVGHQQPRGVAGAGSPPSPLRTEPLSRLDCPAEPRSVVAVWGLSQWEDGAGTAPAPLPVHSPILSTALGAGPWHPLMPEGGRPSPIFAAMGVRCPPGPRLLLPFLYPAAIDWNSPVPCPAGWAAGAGGPGGGPQGGVYPEPRGVFSVLPPALPQPVWGGAVSIPRCHIFPHNRVGPGGVGPGEMPLPSSSHPAWPWFCMIP